MSLLMSLIVLGVASQSHAVKQTKKHKSAKSQAKSSTPKFSASKKAHSNNHVRAHHWLPGPKVNADRRVELVKEIGAELNDAGTSTLTNAKALRGFFAALDERASGATLSGNSASTDSTAQTLRVLQFGDSHTAADVFGGEARRILQEKFGNGGVGYVFAGHP